MTFEICYSFFGDNNMKRNIVIIIMIIIVLLLSLLYLKNNVMISENSNLSYVDDSDIIGSIKIKSIDLSNILVQGLDNNYYLNHNYLKELNNYGEIFLDYQGDLINNNNPIIYSNINNMNNIINIKTNDIIEIFYLYKSLCYKVINSKKNSNLELRIFEKNNINKYFAKKIKC